MTAATELSGTQSWQSWQYERTIPGGVVVGVDGSRQSIAALNSAAAIARRRNCALHAVTVLSPFPAYQLRPVGEDSEENVNRLRMRIRNSELRDIVKVLEPQDDWTHEVIIGRPPRELTLLASHRDADLLVIGRRQHGAMDRVLGGETTLQIMRRSANPVLAVENDLEIPRTVVVAVDFSPSSVLAAKQALQLMNGSGSLYLVFVEPPSPLAETGFPAPLDSRFPGGSSERFRRFIDDLGDHRGILMEPVILTGRAASAVVQFAERVGADLIAAGSHGHGRLERFLLGSVSTGIVRNAGCAVLIVPPCR